MTHSRYHSVDAAALLGDVAALLGSDGNLRESSAEASRYRWERFKRWMTTHRIDAPYTSDDLRSMLTAHEGHAHGTLRGVVVAVDRGHRREYGTGIRDDAVDGWLRGYARLHGRDATPADSISTDELRVMVAAASGLFTPFVAARIIVMMLVSYGAWTRGTETTQIDVPGLPVGALAEDAAGHRIRLGPTKRAPGGETVVLDLPEPFDVVLSKAVASHEALAVSAGIDLTAGPWFPSTQDPDRPLSMGTYSGQIKKLARHVGLPHVSTHSFRRTGATHAATTNRPVPEILSRGRWASAPIAAQYVDVDPFAAELQIDYPATL